VTGSDRDFSVFPSRQHIRIKNRHSGGSKQASSACKAEESQNNCSASADSVMEIQTHNEPESCLNS
jgi:hypothetical protein